MASEPLRREASALAPAPVESYAVALWPFWFWMALLALALAGVIWAALSLAPVGSKRRAQRHGQVREAAPGEESLTLGRRLHIAWLWFVYIVACIGMGWSATWNNTHAPGAPANVSQANDIKRRIETLKSGR